MMEAVRRPRVQQTNMKQHRVKDHQSMEVRLQMEEEQQQSKQLHLAWDHQYRRELDRMEEQCYKH